MKQIGLVCVGGLIAVLTIIGVNGALDRGVPYAHYPASGYHYRLPTQPISPGFERSLRVFRDMELWRDFYGVGQIGATDFCTKGDYRHESGAVYRRLPAYTHYGPYRPLGAAVASGKLGDRIVPLPQDGRKFHVTLVYLDKQTDPASKHLANMFMQDGHWLDQLRHKTHFRTASYGDDFYLSWLAPKFGLKRDDLPCVIVTEPIDKLQPDRNQHGRLVYYAPAHDCPWNPDELAYEIWTQMSKGPYASFSRTSFRAGGFGLYSQCGPNCPPSPSPERPGRLLPFRPRLGLGIDFGAIGGVVMLLIVLAFVAGVVLLLSMRSEK